jgi:hypothetical protein
MGPRMTGVGAGPDQDDTGGVDLESNHNAAERSIRRRDETVSAPTLPTPPVRQPSRNRHLPAFLVRNERAVGGQPKAKRSRSAPGDDML